MFGYVIANLDALTQDDRRAYRALYCGLCRALGERHGLWGRLVLTYDMTFLVLLLSALTEEPLPESRFVCPAHPFKKQACIAAPYTPYAADMSAVLAYYQALDDRRDEGRAGASLRAAALRKAAQAAAQRYPRQGGAIRAAISRLSDMETAGETNPDAPANAFGEALGEVFVPEEDHPCADALRAFGWSLGRFIYLMDAALDLTQDLRHERYNALLQVPTAQHLALLQSQMAVCTALYEQLPVVRHKALLDNILYSGVWTRYQSERKGKSAS